MFTIKNQRSFLMINIQLVVSIILFILLFFIKFSFMTIGFSVLILLNIIYLISRYFYSNIICIENNTLLIAKGKKKFEFDIKKLDYVKWHKNYIDKINDTVSLKIKSQESEEIILKLSSFNDLDKKQLINEIQKFNAGKIFV